MACLMIPSKFENSTTRPVIKVEIDTKSERFTLVEDGEFDASLIYEDDVAYNVSRSYSGVSPFVDITSSVRSVTISRGRSSQVYDRFDAGTCTIELADFNSDFMPDNPNSVHYPRVTAMRPVRISATWEGDTFYLFRGYVDKWDIEWEPDENYARVRIIASDLTKVLAKLDTDIDGLDGDTPKGRIDAMLDVHNIPIGFRVLDTGTVTLLQDVTDRRPLWTTMQAIETAEAGSLFVDGRGRIVFKDRTNSNPTGAGLSISDTGGSTASYSAITVSVDDELLYNFVSVTIASVGTEQTVGDSDSEEEFQRRSLILTDVLLETDAQALALAQHLLAVLKTPGLRVDSVTIPTFASNYNAYTALATDLLDPVTVTRSAPGGATLTKSLFVVGVEHRIEPKIWETTFSTRHQTS